MPHMANLPWLPTYLILILMVMIILSNLSYNNSHLLTEAKKNKSSKKQKWSW